MNKLGKTGPRWSAEKRCEFMAFRLLWTGRLNQADLMEAFSLSTQQASVNISEYLEGRKSNRTYDRKAGAIAMARTSGRGTTNRTP